MDKFNSYKQASELLMNHLELSRSALAGMLGVSERSLQDWEKLSVDDSTPKSKRLMLLYNVVKLIKKEYTEITAGDCKDFLYNARIVIDPEDQEEGSISILNYILANPDNKYWLPIIRKSVSDYLEESNLINRHLKNNKIDDNDIKNPSFDDFKYRLPWTDENVGNMGLGDSVGNGTQSKKRKPKNYRRY